MKKEFLHGFSILELTLTLVIILGLAGFFIPRAMNQTSDARTIAINTMSAALNKTVMLSKAEYKFQRNKSVLKIDGRNVNVSAKGYPLGTADGIGAALSPIEGFSQTFGSPTLYTFSVAQTSNCNVSYDPTTGDVTPNTSGC